MSVITWEDAALVVAKVRTFHQPQDIGDSTITSWQEALNAAGVKSRTDAVHAVIRHYATPGNDKWITPADVVSGVKAIRSARLENVTESDLTPDIGHGVHAADWVQTLRARIALVADGAPVAQAIASVPPPKAITAGGES